MSELPDAELVRIGTTEEIAVALLQGTGGEGDSVSGHNTMVHAEEKFRSETDRFALVGRVGDAWAWLVAHGCVGESGGGAWQRVTQQGAAIAASPAAVLDLQASALLSAELSPALLGSAKPAFARGDYETAAFAALKAVEIEVRRLGQFPAGLVGRNLMQEAFKTGGPLTDPSAESSEQVATSQLFCGAIGAFKNPASHRTVHFDDPFEAAEVVQLADLLLRMLRRIDERINTPQNA
ncbi:TIGR02391 family protein [Plantibacter sp. CFBP 13570]|uniref:TIGR02391 family protein n=1 Tax=Plantibacter sp. CFBP 13570 TaxID=2775272 RepID=UPI0019308E37|nr:TIGR02391 family protein [Plantibacter sp. CFBP 13570]MBD8535689.1 TIGR02391 family protein [Plantibacter sp. CFBP 13570]